MVHPKTLSIAGFHLRRGTAAQLETDQLPVELRTHAALGKEINPHVFREIAIFIERLWRQ